MPNFRIPADPEYTAILGRAIYNFTYYESVVIHTMDRIHPGYLATRDAKGPTAGTIHREFVDRLKAYPSALPEVQASLEKCADAFGSLVKERDKLLHAHPYTANGDIQQLGYRGRHPSADWPMSEVEAVAGKFDDAACELSELFDRALR